MSEHLTDPSIAQMAIDDRRREIERKKLEEFDRLLRAYEISIDGLDEIGELIAPAAGKLTLQEEARAYIANLRALQEQK